MQWSGDRGQLEKQGFLSILARPLTLLLELRLPVFEAVFIFYFFVCFCWFIYPPRRGKRRHFSNFSNEALNGNSLDGRIIEIFSGIFKIWPSELAKITALAQRGDRRCRKARGEN